MSLVDFLGSMEEQEEEMAKLAAEEDAAGRIMARGFMDELNKLAASQWAKKPRTVKGGEGVVRETVPTGIFANTSPSPKSRKMTQSHPVKYRRGDWK